MTHQFRMFLLILVFPLSLFAQKANKYGYPIVDKKITYEKSIKVEGTKEKLYKRGQQFVAFMDFGRSLEVKTHSKNQRNTVLVNDPVTYQDSEEGKIFGNGVLPFEYRGHDYFFLMFKYRIYVEDGQYRYVFTDFVVKELWDAGRASGKDMGRRKGVYAEDAKTKNFPLEEFVDRMAYERSNEIFLAGIADLKHKLKQAMIGEL